MDIKLKVTQERFDEIVGLEDWINFSELTNGEIYAYMVQFVVDEDGKPVPAAEARKLFKKVPKKEWVKYASEFVRAVTDAFVNPTSGGGSSSPSIQTEPSHLQDGSES